MASKTNPLKLCAHWDVKPRPCKRKADPGHIFCTSCRLASGGYNRERHDTHRLDR